MHLVAEGVMSPGDVDKTIRYSIGLRWSFMGPFETMDLNAPEGFKDYAQRYRRSYESMGAQLRVADPWEQDAIDKIETMRRGVASKEKVADRQARSEEHTSELQSLMRISYAVFCLKKKKQTNTTIYPLDESQVQMNTHTY